MDPNKLKQFVQNKLFDFAQQVAQKANAPITAPMIGKPVQQLEMAQPTIQRFRESPATALIQGRPQEFIPRLKTSLMTGPLGALGNPNASREELVNATLNFSPATIAGAKAKNFIKAPKSQPSLDRLESIMAHIKQFPRSMDIDSIKAEYRNNPAALKLIEKTQQEIRDVEIKAKQIVPVDKETGRVADNLQKYNPGLARTEAEAIARDVISNRAFNTQGATPQVLAEEAGGMPPLNPERVKWVDEKRVSEPIARSAVEEMGIMRNKYKGKPAFEKLTDAEKKALDIRYKELGKTVQTHLDTYGGFQTKTGWVDGTGEGPQGLPPTQATGGVPSKLSKEDQALINVAKSFGTDAVIPNDNQLKQWTINRVVSGDKTVKAKLDQVLKSGKVEPVSATGGVNQGGPKIASTAKPVLAQGQRKLVTPLSKGSPSQSTFESSKPIITDELPSEMIGYNPNFAKNRKGNFIRNKAGGRLEGEVVDTAANWKDKPRLSYARETMERNFEDIMGKDAPAMKARYIEPVKKAEADRIRWLNQQRSEIKAQGIKAGSKESKLLQQFGEKKITLDEVKRQTGNWGRVVKAEKFYRQKYNEYLTEINKALVKNGYDPIPQRQDYFRHFQDVSNVLERFGIPVRDNTLPTDISGLSADFKPGKNFFASALPRLGDQTDFDAVKGIDKYIEGASKQIFHTDNIQNLRLLEKGLREKYAGTTHLSNFVADLSEYTNNLAGKKAMLDRSAEALVGRNLYGVVDRVRKQVGANMVGANIASALTSYIPLTQSLATTSKPAFFRGMIEAMGAQFRNQGLSQKSDFITKRIGSDPIYQNKWDSVANKSFALMKGIDRFVTETIVRGKYHEALGKGMTPQQAMKVADEWAGKIMSGRAVGDMPTLFNSRTASLLTQFQLEVNNQLSFIGKDIPRAYNTPQAISSIGQLLVYGHLFNNLYEQAFGRRPAFDPISVALQAYEDYTNEDLKEGQATKNTIGNISNQLPFTSTLTGGRIPVSGGLPDIGALAKGETNIGKELKKPLFGLLPPAGGMQIKKTLEGLNAFTQGASTTDAGNVRYPIEQTPANLARTAISGQYSTPEARDYFREGRSVLGGTQSEFLKTAGDKKAVYDKFMEERKINAEEDKVREQIKTSGGIGQTTQKVFYMGDDGEVKSVPLNRQLIEPKMTGNADLDKELLSGFSSKITSKINDIETLYTLGKLSAEDAGKQILELKQYQKQIKAKYAKPKKLKFPKIKLGAAPKLKAFKSKPIKLKKVKVKFAKVKKLKPKKIKV